MRNTSFLWDESTFWHSVSNYAMLAPVGGHVQPFVAGGLPEAPETKRRFKNLIAVSGLERELQMRSAGPTTDEDLMRVHPRSYLDQFKALSDKGGGELGLRTPFGPGAYEIAALSAGLAKEAVAQVLKGDVANSYALSRPPGHHCLPEWPNGFCLLANIAVAIEAALSERQAERIAVVDWDVHHGNGTEAIFYDRADVLTISVHQDRCYPHYTGSPDDIGEGEGAGFNMNIPLPPGAGHDTYLQVMEQLVLPRLRRFDPDLVIVACGFDAAAVDPLSRMMCTAETYRLMTRGLMSLTNGRFVAVHEGGYSELYVPFCGHAMLEEMSGTTVRVEDPLKERLDKQQPDARLVRHFAQRVSELADHFGLRS